MPPRLVPLWLVLALPPGVALLLACTPPTVSADAGLTVEQTCANSAYARCSRIQACSTFAVATRYGSAATCEADIKAFCINAFAAPSSGRTVAASEACVAAFPTWACVDDLVNQNPPPACQAVAGQLSDGSPCAFGDQCQSTHCLISLGAACGTCAPPAAAGDPCADPSDCGLGSSLGCTTDAKKCAAWVGAGGACGSGAPCVDGLRCVGASSDGGTQGTCEVSVSTPGGACDPSGAQCSQYAGLACDTQSQQCVTASLVGAGQPCGLVGTALVYCKAGACVPTGTGTSTCQAYSDVGGPCDVASGPGCISPSRCVVASGGSATSGTCTILDGTKCQ
jgi:hypothetical protein